MKNFLKTSDFSRAELEDLVAAAFEFKRGADLSKPLNGKSIALVFLNPSVRTRASMQVGVYELGGNPVLIEPGFSSWAVEFAENVVMDSDKAEHIAEFVRVLGRYCAAVGVRSFANLQNWEAEKLEPVLSAFARHSEVPILNLESATAHPFQSLADMMTIRERFGERRKKVLLTWAWHPKPLPMAVPNGFALAAAQFGHDLTISHPNGYELDDDFLREIETQANENGGSVTFSNDAHAAFDGAEVVYAKSWGAKQFYGNSQNDIEFRAALRNDWIVDAAKMRRTNSAVFMHCLPVRRNVIVTDEVIDSPNSIIIDQAENRLHIQKAIMAEIIK